MDKVELRARLDFWQSALSKLRAAYLALVDGGVKSYVIDDRELTRFDLPDLKDEIEDAEKKVDELFSRAERSQAEKGFRHRSTRLVTFFREVTKLIPAKRPKGLFAQAAWRSLLFRRRAACFFIPKTGGDKH